VLDVPLQCIASDVCDEYVKVAAAAAASVFICAKKRRGREKKKKNEQLGDC
jgi:hypothetical protein